MSEYEFVSRSSLKLKSKSDSDSIKKKRRKTDKKSDNKIKDANVFVSNRSQNKSWTQVEESPQGTTTESTPSTTDSSSSSSRGGSTTMTKAEKSFLEMQSKRQIDRIMLKASKSHKQRVEEFNRHLDSLTEHYDIPKVSWTK